MSDIIIWSLIGLGISIIMTGLVVALYQFFSYEKTKQLNLIRQWLLYAVAVAEEQFGSETGALKLRFVYDLFVTRFPKIKVFISFEYFSTLVDDALVELIELIDNNSKIESLLCKNDLL